MSAKSSIQVCIKVRPCEPEYPNLWQVKDKRTIHLIDSPADPCVYDYVFDQGSNNQEVFDGMAKHIVEACVKGFNGTIFAYGQTSSGKTYTMMGDKENPGVMVLAAKEIFNQITNNSDRDFLLRVGYIEIYNEKIYDLLNKKNLDLKIYESNGMVNINCQECIITSEEDLLRFLSLGNKERTVGETNMNERSSRSHAIFRIIIESRKTDRSEEDAVAQSILNLVDLAGSERADQTGARGTRLKEGSHINKSLLFLSNVIKSLAENEDNRFVNYRDSKLTRILQASLGGNAFTSIICTIRPSNMEESQSTLNFAMRAKKIRVKPQLNEIVSDATMMKRLEREIRKLRDLLADEQAKNESQLKVRQLEQRIKTDTLKIITSNTITDHRNKLRRRTWCPASSNPEVVPEIEAPIPEQNGSNGQAFNINHSNLPKPSFYPTTSNANLKACKGSKTINIMKSLEVKEELLSVVENNFEPVAKSRMKLITLTPTMAQMGDKGREMLEREVVELEAFMKIEEHINSEWEELNNKLTVAQATIDELQVERLNLLQRSEDLQADVEALRKSKEEADAKVAQYEQQLKTLKQTVERLDMENRAAVELEFQFNSHKSKSKKREDELLTVLSEKDCAIDNLQKSLNELSNEVLRNSKDDHMRSICPTLETSCELICKKCIDLEHLLEEYNNRPSADNGALELDCECEQLRVDIAKTRAQLESVQDCYKQMNNDAIEKSELCDRLSRDVISAVEARNELQVKFDDLEQTKLRHEQIIKSMQEEYNVIQQKYLALQQGYESLEQTAVASEEQHKKLHSENESLQNEITFLKDSFEKLRLSMVEKAAAEDHAALLQQLKESNEELMLNLAEMEAKYSDLQVEYDDLSNQLMESVQEGDSLREECNALQEKLKKTPSDADQLQAHIAQLQLEVAEKTQLLDATESTINEMREQMTNLQSELLEKSVIVNKVEDYQRQIESLEKQHAEITMVCEELQEKVKETTMNESMSKSSSTIQADDSVQEEEEEKKSDKLEQLSEQVQELKNEIKKQLSLVQQKDERIHELQLEIQLLNERCLSMDVQQVELRANAQQQQQLLDIQAAKLADDISRIDQLQESNAKLTDRSIKAEEALEQRLKLAADIEATREEYEKRLRSLQISLDNAKEEFDRHEKLQKDELDSVKLEFLQKIEVSENRYRENMHKYNSDWEDRLEKLTAEGEAKILTVTTEFSVKIDQFVQEKHELETLYDDSQKLVEQLQQKLSCSEQEKCDAEMQREQLTSSTEKLQELHEKCDKQLQDYEQLKLNLENLKQEKVNLQTVVDDYKLTIERLKQELETEQKLREVDEKKQLELSLELEEALLANITANTEFNEQLETCKSKINDLQEEVHKANLHALDVKKLAAEYDELQDAMAKTDECNKNLAQRVEELENELEKAQTEVTTHKSELDSLQEKLDNTLEMKNNVNAMEAMFEEKFLGLKNEMSEQTHELKRKIKELMSSKDELNLKIDSLQARRLELETSNEELTLKLKNKLNSCDLLEKEQAQNSNLQAQLQAKQAECESLQQALQETESQLKSKQAEYDATQDCLQQAEFSLKSKLAEYDQLFEAMQEVESKLEATQTTCNTLQQVESQLKAKQTDCDNLQQSLHQAELQLSANQQSLQQLESQLEIKRAACDTLQQSLQQAESLLNAKQNECVALSESLQQVKSELDNNQASSSKLPQLESKLQVLQESLQQAESLLKAKQLECAALEESLQQVKSELEVNQISSGKLQQLESELQQAELKINAKQAGYDILLQTLQQAESQLDNQKDACAALQQNLQQAESQLKAKQSECKTLQQNLQQAESQLQMKQETCDTLQHAQSQLKDNKTELDKLQQLLQQSESELKNKQIELDTLQLNLQEAESQLQLQQTELEMLQLNLQQTESQLKNKQTELEELQQLKSQLEIKQSECDKLQHNLQQLEAQQSQAATAVNSKNVELSNQVKTLQTEMDKLRSLLKTNKMNMDSDRSRLDATISSLLEDKRNLEEKLCTTNEIVQKLEMDLRNKTHGSNNVSFDSNTSSNASPAPRLSHEREAQQPRKSLSLECEVRRNKRITTYDERRQSYWNDSRHVACMTDPVDTNCNCMELDRKLKECQFELFIRDSKVTALNIELKNHPLKEENALLKKRLQEEQHKARDELKRVKSKYADLMSKLNTYTTSNAASCNTNRTAPKPSIDAETQTESELEAELKKTCDKLNDCMQLCRHRYNHIKGLEDKLRQNENSDTTNISSQTAGEIIFLKSKLDAQKKEIATLNNKYEFAKKALKLRKDEIEKLRREAETDVSVASSK